jgi:hypothetical protein
MSSVIAGAVEDSGGSQLTIFATTVGVVGRFATWKFYYV